MAAQALQRGMAELAGPAGAEAAADALRIVDTYIKVCSHCCLRVRCGLGARSMVFQARAPGPGPPRIPRSAIVTGVADGESQYLPEHICADDKSGPLAGSLWPFPYTIALVRQLPYMPKPPQTMKAFTQILICLMLTTGILSSMG